jgi:hypothetical protein
VALHQVRRAREKQPEAKSVNQRHQEGPHLAAKLLDSSLAAGGGERAVRGGGGARVCAAAAGSLGARV